MNRNNKISVIIPAAGAGSRFKAKKPKQYCMLGSQTILEQTVSIFIDIPEVQIIYIAVHPDDQLIQSQSFFNHPKIQLFQEEQLEFNQYLMQHQRLMEKIVR